ncbi:MAG: TolC family protein [Thermoanaerobaculia bacterium]|nr:TolC family protein [Thermoanaerobaculia bacterium]
MRAISVAFCATILLTRALVAETGPRITESEFLRALESGHPALVALAQAVAEAESAARAARVLANPELAASRETPGELEQLDVAVSWQLPHPSRRRLAAAAADAEIAAARARFEAERADLVQRMRETYARWATSSAAAGSLRRWSGEVERLAERERERAASGEASGLDARRLALAASEVRGQLARAEAERLEAFAAARAWKVDLAPDAMPELPPLREPGATAEAHPRLRALRAELESATAERDLASRVFDMPSVSAGWQRQEAAGEVADGATLGLIWTVPLLDRRQAERARARARAEAASARLELATREIRSSREGALAAYGGLSAAAAAARTAASESPAVVRAATAAFQAGETSVTDLLDALRSAAEAELAALDLYAEALAAHRRLELLLGAPLGDDAGKPTIDPTTLPPDPAGDLP